MMTIKNYLNKENITKAGKAIVKGVKTVSPYLVGMVGNEMVKTVVDAIRYSGDVNYDDAVGVIMSSSMWSSDKKTAVSAIKKGCSSETYKAIIKTVRSSMWSSDKVELIKSMCKENS